MSPNPTCPHCHSTHVAIIRPYPLRASYGWAHDCLGAARVTMLGFVSAQDAAQSWAVWCAAAQDELEEFHHA